MPPRNGMRPAHPGEILREELEPVAAGDEAYRDTTRQALDEAVLLDLLGLPSSILDSLDLLRTQWCNEPTVHGGKSTRPRAFA